MKNLFILVLLGVFSVPAFGQQKVVAEQVEEKASEKVKVSDKSDKKEETKSSETKEASEKADSEEKKVSEGTSSSEKQVSEKTKDSKEEQVPEETKPVEEKQREQQPAEEEQVPEETKPVEEKQREQQPAKEEQVPEETKPVEEKQREQQPAAVNQESDSAGSAVSVQAGVNYMCDEGRSYTLHEPGMDSENHLCELDAGHTESPVDWYALNQSSFCREKLQKIITLYNCVIKK